MTPVQYDRMGDEYGHRADRAGLLKRYKHRVNARLFRGAARLLPWSRWVADSLVTDYGVAPERIEVIPPGIDLARWTPGSGGEEGGPVRILFVGADLRRKGGPLLIEAFRAVRPSGIELHLVTRGVMPGEPGLFVYNDMKNNSDALIDLYRRCDIFCLPTTADCLPMALLEAGAAGLPTISTNVAAIPEIVREAETGFLIEPGDLGGLVERIRSLARDPAPPGADGERGPASCGDPLRRAPQRPSRARGPAGDGRDPERLQGGLTGCTPRRSSPRPTGASIDVSPYVRYLPTRLAGSGTSTTSSFNSKTQGMTSGWMRIWRTSPQTQVVIVTSGSGRRSQVCCNQSSRSPVDQ